MELVKFLGNPGSRHSVSWLTENQEPAEHCTVVDQVSVVPFACEWFYGHCRLALDYRDGLLFIGQLCSNFSVCLYSLLNEFG